MRLVRLLALTLALSTAAVGLNASPAVAYHHGHLRARLVGSTAYPDARGHADYERMMCCGREIDLDLSNLSSLVGKTLAVYAAGTKVGSATVRSGGSFTFYRRGLGVPRLYAGDPVSVETSAGALVASGTLRRVCCMMSPRSG